MFWIGRMWRKRQRNIDIAILWPACRNQASDLCVAREAFLSHCFCDPAWTKDFDFAQIRGIVKRMK